MGKLDLIEKLNMAAWSGDMLPLKNHAEELEDIKALIYQSVEDQIVQDITDREFLFYAPEYSSWTEALLGKNKNRASQADYSVILNTKFTEEELAELWELSHIADPLSDDDRLNMLTVAIGLAQKYESILDSGSQQEGLRQLRRKSIAFLKGLYNVADKRMFV